MSQYAIVAIGYNRAESMQRLLNSLSKAYYGNDQVTLIISIDNSGTDSVEMCAKKFQWKYGEKRIVTYPERQGLRKHILHCGEFVKDYDAIAVFEDDVVAAPGFYQYMKETVDKYQSDDRIAGISLYNHRWNVNVNRPFEAAYSKYDVYLLQFAQSWGQIWMKKQWIAFSEWYETNNEEFAPQNNIPSFVSGWPKTSWLKYHIKYCIETHKFFIYPYKSLSTCYSDIGEHCEVKDTHLQVPMLTDVKSGYCLPDLCDKDVVAYDAFFERIAPDCTFVNGIKSDEICFDLYGSKTSFDGKEYLISKKSLPYRVIKQYGLELRPHEENVQQEVSGDKIFLYSLKETDTVKKKINMRKNKVADFRYAFRLYGKTASLCSLILDTVKEKCGGQIKLFR